MVCRLPNDSETGSRRTTRHSQKTDPQEEAKDTPWSSKTSIPNGFRPMRLLQKVMKEW